MSRSTVEKGASSVKFWHFVRNPTTVICFDARFYRTHKYNDAGRWDAIVAPSNIFAIVWNLLIAPLSKEDLEHIEFSSRSADWPDSLMYCFQTFSIYVGNCFSSTQYLSKEKHYFVPKWVIWTQLGFLVWIFVKRNQVTLVSSHAAATYAASRPLLRSKGPIYTPSASVWWMIDWSLVTQNTAVLAIIANMYGRMPSKCSDLLSVFVFSKKLDCLTSVNCSFSFRLTQEATRQHKFQWVKFG